MAMMLAGGIMAPAEAAVKVTGARISVGKLTIAGTTTLPTGTPIQVCSHEGGTFTSTMTACGARKTAGPAITANVPASGKALVTLNASVMSSSRSVPCGASFAVSGASSVAANDTTSHGVTSGSNTFTMQYRIQFSGQTCTFGDRNIVVIPWPN